MISAMVLISIPKAQMWYAKAVILFATVFSISEAILGHHT